MSLKWAHRARIPPAEGGWMWGRCAGRGGAAAAGYQRGHCTYSGFRLQAVGSRAHTHRGCQGWGCPGSSCTERLPVWWWAKPSVPFEISISITPSSAPASWEKKRMQVAGISCAALEGTYCQNRWRTPERADAAADLGTPRASWVPSHGMGTLAAGS